MSTPEPPPFLPPGRACNACGSVAAVNWQRRLTPAEVAEAQVIEQERRTGILTVYNAILASLDGSETAPPAAPQFGPMPTCTDWTRIVHGCVSHAVTLEAAALVHQASCTAPSTAHLPGCDCTPEAAPQAEPEPGPAPLPAGW
jgi:hypothetical protein